MSPERWQRVKEVLEAALASPPDEREGFLDQVCASDPELRREVDSLMARKTEAEDYLEKPPVSGVETFGASRGLVDGRRGSPAPPLVVGSQLSHYRILEKLGSGGMGDVYLAEDEKLDRKVALKVLPPETARSARRRERFDREAKAIAALDHPNIVHVYSVEEAEGLHFITMQLVRGKTLTKLIPKNGFSMSQFLDIAIPLADAVFAAHSEGITHRDLKPDNVMISDEGHVKVLDFGLAKPTREFSVSSEARTAAKTEAGMIMGTAAYMSPEQAEGGELDHRSDIFSLGIILYEMVTGRRPFSGKTAASLISSILRDAPPPISDINPALPDDLERIIGRCLVKNPEGRFETVKEVCEGLGELKQKLSAATLLAAEQLPRPVGKRGRMGWATATLLGVTVLVAGLWYFSRLPGPSIPRLVGPIQITSAVGVEDYPAWSPDGKTLAYTVRHGAHYGPSDIVIQQIHGGPAVNLTGRHGEMDGFPSWSPDGSQIAFWSGRDGGGYFVMPALGGAARRVMAIARDVPASDDSPSPPQWSGDGSELAGIVYEPDGVFIEITSMTSGESRKLLAPAGTWIRRYDLAWSRDGLCFAYVGAESLENDITQLWALCSDGGEAQAITNGSSMVWSPIWSPQGRSLYFVSNQGGAMDLWVQPLEENGSPVGDASPVTSGVEMKHAALSPDGKRIVYSKGRRVANVFRLPILPDRPATFADAQQLTFDQAYVEYLDVSVDGERLAVQSDRGGNPDIWVVSATGGEMEQIIADPSPDWHPAWSPDGKEIAFYSHRTGNRDIWIAPVVGGPARRITTNPAQDFMPSWSPDGRYIAFHSGRSGNRDVWVISADGGEARQVTFHPADDGFPHWSPDGSRLVFASDRTGDNHLWSVPAFGEGEPTLLAEGPAVAIDWSPDGSRLYFVEAYERDNQVWEVSASGEGRRRVTQLEGRSGRLGVSALATDGQYLYVTWEEHMGDLWIMDVVDE